ncbi:MAG: hypothetical protein IKB07_03575 [Lachnospiraceae bacterium]|nr:hypothetical protein [Lachnospiraceae bacterium]
MKKKTGIAIIGVLVALLLIAAVLCVALVKKYTPNKERVLPEELAPVAEGEAHVVFWQEKYEKNALLLNGGIYLDFETVSSYINEDFYYDEKELVLSYTKPTEIIRAYPMESVYYSNKTKKELSCAPVLTKGGIPYVSLEFVQLFSDVTYTFFENPARVLLRTGTKDMLSLKAKKDTEVRELADIKSRVVCDLAKDSVVWYVDAGTETSTKFVKVMTEDGVFGFVRKKDLSETYHQAYVSDYVPETYPHILSEEEVVLGWHLVTNSTANAGLENLIKNNKQLTVVSPTWFRITGPEAENPLLSLADASYVEKANSYGLAVWGLVDNFDIAEEEGFDPTENSFAILSSTKKREELVNALVAEAIRYNLDGLNIDFESLSVETGPHFIQFLRELSVKCRANGLVLSVDNYVPSAYAAYYDWQAQGEVVDYVVIMAYDEHYAGSETAGSVASYGYLTTAVDNILTMVPKEQVIMAVPFYTRLWTETKENGVTKLTSIAIDMATAEAEVSRNNVTPVWDTVTRQNYAEYEKGGAVCKMWLEDSQSLAEKLSYIRSTQLAGVAVWQLAFGTEEVWQIFETDVLAE